MRRCGMPSHSDGVRAVNMAIRFVGGPADGRTMTISGVEPPPLYLVPNPPPLAEALANPLGLAPIPKAEYVPILECGEYQRARDGVFLYRHRVAPSTADERRTLQEKRRAAREAEERRAAELDEAWREIRRERPDFPEGWRDAF